ncbi:GIY-YIG nuclease family protein [Fulvivirgaceae bacterium BMA10]|uniref:GIY-YIG nuclease family protein n=1 Tax=Splendidivirga corallicola TaxID=3051826 RepID=A0ABT8KWW5_9BACT|nr:GIY-YIG nuclease family protein [Fulvivirgaceae bacterium BMA10]
MYYTYVLFSPIHRKIYIGYSSNLMERIRSHNELATKGWTIRYRPWILAYYEMHATKALAMKREKQLKSAQGRKFIWGIVEQKFG